MNFELVMVSESALELLGVAIAPPECATQFLKVHESMETLLAFK